MEDFSRGLDMNLSGLAKKSWMTALLAGGALLLFLGGPSPKAWAGQKAAISFSRDLRVEGGLPVPAGMRQHPEKFFPVCKGVDTLEVLHAFGFHTFDDVDHHRKEIKKTVGLNLRNARLIINIPRRCFWVSYHFWKKRDRVMKYLPHELMDSLFDMAITGRNDEMGGILCLKDMKSGKVYLGFGMFTLRKRFKTDNRVSGRTNFHDYVALKETSPKLVAVLKEVTAWIVPRKKDLTRVYWNPIGKKLVDERNAKL